MPDKEQKSKNKASEIEELSKTKKKKSEVK